MDPLNWAYTSWFMGTLFNVKLLFLIEFVLVKVLLSALLAFWPQVAYYGVFPSVDGTGHRLTGIRATQAGQKLAGGPYALTSIRPEWENTNECVHRKVVQFAESNLSIHSGCLSQKTLFRGDWKWLKESWNLKRWWRIKRGICFKCRATSAHGPNVWLDNASNIRFLCTCTIMENKTYISPQR